MQAELNDAVIRRLAGDRSYQRGRDYYQHGHVESSETTPDSIHAVVRGNQDYTVALSSDDGVLEYSCNCPQGADGAFCKHCVAAALAWLHREASPPKASSRRKGKEITLADAAKILQAEDKDALIRLMLDWARDDARLRERILLYAARKSDPESGVAAAARAFRNAVRVRGFLTYREASAWARGVDDAIDHIAQLLADGQAAAVIELCESALRALVSAGGSIDDSDGHLTHLRDRLEEIHFHSCQEARPEPVALARRLLDFQLHSDLDVFYDAAERYAKILGTKGMSEYRQLAEAEWQKVPAATPKSERADWGSHFRITRIMQSLARASGDIEELVSVMSRDLSHAYGYLKIAEVYREARQHDQALLWAEKGLKAFPQRTDGRLREFAAEEYHRTGRHDDAMTLMWAEFSERPSLETYGLLHRHAKKAGAWPQWRERALGEIRRRIAAARQEPAGKAEYRWMRPTADHSQLVEIFLHERDLEAAWREAQEGGCSDRLWLQLAAAREEKHPADAAPIYMKQAEAAVSATTNGRYEDPVHLLVKAAALMKQMDRREEFVRSLDAMCAKYKMKRNFIKLVQQNRRYLYIS